MEKYQFSDLLVFQFLHRFHHLKLYPEDESGPMSTKKPVVVESYDEIVFPEPSESFLARVQNHPAIVSPRLPSALTLPPPGISFMSSCLQSFVFPVVVV